MITITGNKVVNAPPRRPLVGPFPKRYVQTYCFWVTFMLLLMRQHAYIIYRTFRTTTLKAQVRQSVFLGLWV
jgi:hypothetical protein